MGITIPTENKKVKLQSKAENPVIKPCRKKNFLVAKPQDVTVVDVEPEPQKYRRIVLR